MIIKWLRERWFNREAKRALEKRALEKRALDERRQIEQSAIQRELGIDQCDGTQAWLRLHQLLKSHEDRIAALEGEQ